MIKPQTELPPGTRIRQIAPRRPGRGVRPPRAARIPTGQDLIDLAEEDIRDEAREAHEACEARVAAQRETQRQHERQAWRW